MIDISVANLVKEFEVGTKILDGLTFRVDTGERVGLLGPNGCGKTTLLRILTGVLDCDEGEVMTAPGKRMGLISQIPVYPAGYTVEDVLDTAFTPLREMEEEMQKLSVQMEQGGKRFRFTASLRQAVHGLSGGRRLRDGYPEKQGRQRPVHFRRHAGAAI